MGERVRRRRPCLGRGDWGPALPSLTDLRFLGTKPEKDKPEAATPALSFFVNSPMLKPHGDHLDEGSVPTSVPSPTAPHLLWGLSGRP